MAVRSLLRYAVTAVVGVGAAALLASGLTPARSQSSTPDTEQGFVVSHIRFALGADAAGTGACPNGMTQGYANGGDVFVNAPQLQQEQGETEDQYIRRMFQQAMSDPNVRNLCLNPELGHPNPTFQTVSGNVPAEGIDLDAQDSRGGSPAPGTCSHSDFRGMNGERGIDNQFYRLVGCSNSYQSTGQSNTWEIEMYTGSWGILMTLKGLDDRRNDPDVEVSFYANADPIQVSPTREAVRNATYAAEQNPAYSATTHGRIVNGVLTTDPVDVNFHWVVNSIRLDRVLKHARAQMTFTPDGALDGVLAGYTPVEALYDVQYGFRNGQDGAGQPAPLRLRTVSSIGQARVLGHTCEGAYFAMRELADGDRDPTTGDCTSVSTQYHITAIPAFVVQAETSSVNGDLDPTSSDSRQRY